VKAVENHYTTNNTIARVIEPLD